MLNYIPLITISLLLLLPLASQAAKNDELSTAVTSAYRITTPAFLGGFNSIGDVLTPKQEGLRADRPSKIFKVNVVKDQRLAVAGGGDLPMPGGVHSGILKTGEQLYLYGVTTGEDYLQLELFTVKTYVLPGMRGPTPLQASVRFQYEAGLAAVTPPQLLDDINKWFDTEERDNSTWRRRGAVGPTRTVKLGQTLAEVTSIFGTPEKQVLLGNKVVFVYCDLKVIFIDGKVTDAE